jgi:hypothetical protein
MRVTGFMNDGVKVSLPPNFGDVDSVIPAAHFAEFLMLSHMIWKSMGVGRKRSIRANGVEIPRDAFDIEVGHFDYGNVSGVQEYCTFVSFFGLRLRPPLPAATRSRDSIRAFGEKIDESGCIYTESNRCRRLRSRNRC